MARYFFHLGYFLVLAHFLPALALDFNQVLKNHKIDPSMIVGKPIVSDGKVVFFHEDKKICIFDIQTGKRIIDPNPNRILALADYKDFENIMQSAEFRHGIPLKDKDFSLYLASESLGKMLTNFAWQPEITYNIIRKSVLAILAGMQDNCEKTVRGFACPPVWRPDNKGLLCIKDDLSTLDLVCPKSFKPLKQIKYPTPVRFSRDGDRLVLVDHPGGDRIHSCAFLKAYPWMLAIGSNKGIHFANIENGCLDLKNYYICDSNFQIFCTSNDQTYCKNGKNFDRITPGMTSFQRLAQSTESMQKILWPDNNNQTPIILWPKESQDRRPSSFSLVQRIITARFETQTVIDGSLSSQGHVAFIEQDPDTQQTTINFWDEKTRAKTASNVVDIPDMQTLSWSPKGDSLAIAAENELYIYDTKTKETTLQAEHDKAIKDISWSPNGRQISLCSDTSKPAETSVKIVRLYDKNLLERYLTNELNANELDGKKPPILEQWLLLYLLMGYKQPEKPMLINSVIKHINENLDTELTLAQLTAIKDLFPGNVQRALGDLFDIRRKTNLERITINAYT